MRTRARVFATLLLASCAGTASRSESAELSARGAAPDQGTADPSAPTVALEDDGTPDGPECGSTEECADGQHCRGPTGCGADWACGEPRECGEETVSYCGCDHFTFYAPADCPGRPYQSVGPCEALGEALDDEPEPVAGSAICERSDDCGRGRVCVGTEGCSTYWTCERRARVRPRCTSRQEHFCGCDGVTFEASATCPGRPFMHRGHCLGDEPEPTAVAERPEPSGRADRERARTPRTVPASAVCTSNRDCPRGQVCQGPEGCGAEWRCAPPAERCVSDRQYFCSCEGRTFTASMTCPGRPYRHRGSCPPAD